MAGQVNPASRNDSSTGTWITSEGSSSLEVAKGTTTHLSTATVKYRPFASGPTWHLPNGWNWSGDNNDSRDVTFDQKAQFQGKEWAAWTDSAVLGHSNAVVTRVICNQKVLARKTVRIDRRRPTAHLQEVHILREVSHQHIIQLCGTYTLGNKFHLLLYPVAERDLREFMHQGQRDNGRDNNWARTLINGMGCLSNALAYLHSADIKHKDIKPENVLVLGNVLIFSDFGSASNFNERDDGSKSYGLCGMTRLYAPPEAVNGEEHGRSADIFSLGLVMSEMIEYIFGWPAGPSRVERRLQDQKDGKLPTSSFLPEPITNEEEEFLQCMGEAPKVILVEDMKLLCSVMSGKDPLRRPTSIDVCLYLRDRHFEDEDGFATCGKCCKASH